MAAPFSNTHLRVPRGFGSLMEGLTREVLRDQPEDIPKYAARYFSALLKQREDRGLDPSEWAANLEDAKVPVTTATLSKENPYESQTEDEASNISTTQPTLSKEVDLSQSTGDEEETHDITEKSIILTEEEPSEEQSVSGLPAADVQADEPSGTEEASDPTTNTSDHSERPSNGKDSSPVPDRDVPQPELDPTKVLSVRDISNVDVCAQELGIAEDEEGDKQEAAVADSEVEDSEGEGKSDTEQPMEVSPYSGSADVDVCAAELIGTERTEERHSAIDEMNVIEEENSKPQTEETIAQPSLSQSGIPEDSQEVEDPLEKTKEEGTEAEMSSEGIHQSVTHMEGSLDRNVSQKEDSLVEISFEDVPESQQIINVEEKHLEVEDSVEALQTNVVQMQQEEESNQVTAVAVDQNISATQDYKEPETGAGEEESDSEEEEKESQHETSDIMREKVGTHDSNLTESEGEEKVECVETISPPHQTTGEADEEKPEYGSEHKSEDNGKTSEGELHQSESNDLKEDEAKDVEGGEEEETHKEGYSAVVDQEIDDSGTKTPISQITSMLTPAVEAERETFEPNEQHPPETDEEGQGILVESQQENEGSDEGVERSSEAEELKEEGNLDSEIQESSDAVCVGGISPPQTDRPTTADHEKRLPESEEDTTEPEGLRVDQQEDCSRPQEEEDIMDIPLDDPEANRAAAKIQAGFRGHMTRKKMKPEDKAEGEERQEDRGQ